MPEMRKTESHIRASQVDGSPIGCSLCQAVVGPFVAIGQSRFTILMPDGAPRVVDEPLLLCAPIIEEGLIVRRGCAGHIADTIGFVAPDVLALSQEATTEALGQCAELEQKVNELTESQVSVVSVKELEALIEGKSA